MFNSLRSLESQPSLKCELLKENEKTTNILNFPKGIGHRRKMTNENPFVLTEHYVAARHESPRMGTLSWKVKVMALFKGRQSESVQPQIMQARPVHRHPERRATTDEMSPGIRE